MTANADGDSVSVLLGNGSGGFAAKLDHATGGRPLSLTVADFNRDGKPDVATANAFGSSITVLLGSGSGTFASRKDYKTGWFADSIAAGDLNGDGIPDLVYAADDKVSVRLGDGKGGFGGAATYPTGAGAETVAIGDVTGDGHADLLVSTGAGNALSVLPGDGSGRFATGTQFPAEAHATDNQDEESLALADFNGDGRTDVAFSNDRLARLYIYRGELGARRDRHRRRPLVLSRLRRRRARRRWADRDDPRAHRHNQADDGCMARRRVSRPGRQPALRRARRAAVRRLGAGDGAGEGQPWPDRAPSLGTPACPSAGSSLRSAAPSREVSTRTTSARPTPLGTVRHISLGAAWWSSRPTTGGVSWQPDGSLAAPPGPSADPGRRHRSSS